MSQATNEIKKIKGDIEKSYRRGNIQNAIELCQSALLKMPTDADLHIKLGDLYLEWHLDIYQARQYIDEAITEYQRALETHINSGEVYFKIARAQYHKNDLEKAINYYKLAIENNYNLAESNYMLANCFMKKALFVDALEYARNSIKLKKMSNSCAHFLIYRVLRLTSSKANSNLGQSIKELLLSIMTFMFDKNAIRKTMETFSYFKFIPAIVKGMIKAQTQSLTPHLPYIRRLSNKLRDL